jgi:sensor c-di-GMP phosphodiesterase-like protein
MQTMKHRALLALIATLVAGVIGALTAYFLGRVATVSLAERRLTLDVAEAAKQADRSMAESQDVAAAMHASPYLPCSDEEITYFRALLFESRHLKDLGRIGGGNIVCSAALGRMARPRSVPRPDFIFQDGTRVYKSLPLYQDSEANLVVLQQEDSFVALRPNPVLASGSLPTHFAETVVDAPSQKVGLLRGDPLGADAELLNGDGEVRVRDMLYATRCSTRGLGCVTAFVAIPEVLSAEHLPMAIYCGFGGFSGALLGLLISIFYRRSKGLEQQLRRAVESDSLQLMYQPIVDLHTRNIIGAEALARWTDEDGFSIDPDVFVRVAEERGLMADFTRFVLRRALLEMGPALRHFPGFRLNLNLTSTDLSDPRFQQMLEQSLLEFGVSTRSIGIEITETGTARQQLAMDAIFQLRRRGHRVYIDNFGTGYSSFAYLQDLAVDAIKIDRSFIRAIGTGAVTESNLPLILAMAEALNLEVIVEGIENREQANYFISRDKRIHAQGWLFGYPYPAAEFEKLLAEEHAKNSPPKPEVPLAVPINTVPMKPS